MNKNTAITIMGCVFTAASVILIVLEHPNFGAAFGAWAVAALMWYL